MRAALLAVTLAGCSGSQGEVAVPPAPTASGAAAVPAPDTPLPDLPDWTWTGPPDPSAHRDLHAPSVDVAGGGRCHLTYGKVDAIVQCELPTGPWSATLRRDRHWYAAVAASSRALFVVGYHPFATGAELFAYDLRKGKLLWSHPLEGCGRVAHSEYYNAVQIRASGEHAIVFGSEVACRYVELVHGDKGVTSKHRRLPAR